MLGGLVHETGVSSRRLPPVALVAGLGLVMFALAQRVPLAQAEVRLFGFLGLSAILGLLAAASP